MSFNRKFSAFSPDQHTTKKHTNTHTHPWIEHDFDWNVYNLIPFYVMYTAFVPLHAKFAVTIYRIGQRYRSLNGIISTYAAAGKFITVLMSSFSLSHSLSQRQCLCLTLYELWFVFLCNSQQTRILSIRLQAIRRCCASIHANLWFSWKSFKLWIRVRCPRCAPIYYDWLYFKHSSWS